MSTADVPGVELANRATAAKLALALAVTPDEFTELRSGLMRFARGAVVGLQSNDEALEAVDASLEKFARASAVGRVRGETALAYLRAIVRNTAIDLMAQHRVIPVAEAEERARQGPEEDEAIARILDARATATVIERLLRESADAGDTTSTRVANAFLDLAEELMAAPDSRLVAKRVGLSHTTVHRTLRKFKERLSEVDVP